MIKIIYIICHISIPYNSTEQMNVETSKNMKYYTDTIYDSRNYHGHV